MFPAQTRNVSFYNMLKVASRALKQVTLYYLLVPVNQYMQVMRGTLFMVILL